jgi:flagellar biosynthesis chaperone FliJ
MKKSPATNAERNTPKAQYPRIVYSKCRALIPLNTEEIRQSELRKLKRQKANCAELDAQLAQFEKEEILAHQQWIQTHCGPAITEYRKLHAELTQLEKTVDLTFELIGFYPNRRQQECADAAVLYFETNGQIPEGYEDFFNPSFAQGQYGSNPFEDEDEDEFMNEFAESLRDFEALIDDMFNDVHPNHGKHSPRNKYLQEQKVIKALYRRIARRLHPDGAGNTTPDQLDLWHVAQTAYETHDRETLERIDAHCELLDKEGIKSSQVSSIQKAIAFYKKSCAQFRRAIKQAKRLPEWGFLTWTEKKKQLVLKKHHQELATEIRYFTRQRLLCKIQLDNLRRPPVALKRTSPKPKKPAPQNGSQTQFDLF